MKEAAVLRTERQALALALALALTGCGPVVQQVVAVDGSCAPVAETPLYAGTFDLAISAAYSASLLVSGGSPEEATVWVVDGRASSAPGGAPEGEIAGMPPPSRPRVATVTQEASLDDGRTVMGVELITAEESDALAGGVIGASVGPDLTVPLLVGVQPAGAPTFHFPIEICFGCLVDVGCTLDRTCRPAQDTPNRCQ
jgi:hypothetical protein